MGSRKLHFYPKVTEIGSIIGHRIDYNGIGAMTGQRDIPRKNFLREPSLSISSPANFNLFFRVGLFENMIDGEKTNNLSSAIFRTF